MPITLNVIDGADYEKVYRQGRITERATRVAVVRGLGSDPAAALVTARALVEAAHPIGTPYDATDAPACLLFGYGAAGISNDDNSARVRLLYETPNYDLGGGGGGGEVAWTIEDDTDQDLIQTQRDPANLTPLTLTWTDPADATNSERDIGTATIIQTVRRIVLSGVVSASQRSAYSLVVGCVNHASWNGLEKGRWLFRSFRTRTVVGSDFWFASAELAVKQFPPEPWSTTLILRTPDGHFVPVTDADMAAAMTSPYSYGATMYNGFGIVGQADLLDFTTVFSGVTT